MPRAPILLAQDAALRQAADILQVQPVGGARARRQPASRSASSLSASLPRRRRNSPSAQVATGKLPADDALRTVGAVTMFARTVHGIQPKDLRGLVDDGKRQIKSGVVAIVGVTDEGKAGIVVGVTDDLTAKYSAVDLVKVGAVALGGQGGGGRPDMAQAGGPNGASAAGCAERNRGLSLRGTAAAA